MIPLPSDRPVLVAIAGPNGAGKSTFYEAFLAPAGLRFVNADRIALELGLEAYAAAEVAARIREELVARGESSVFETVFSDPAGAKVEDLVRWRSSHTVVLCFVGLDDVELSDTRVAMRVSQGGHDVPTEKLVDRFPRILANLARTLDALALVQLFDNSDLASPFRLVAIFRNGRLERTSTTACRWLDEVESLRR